MAVSFDAVGPSSAGVAYAQGGGQPITWSHVCGATGTDGLLVVVCAIGAGGGGAPAITLAVTYDSVSMTDSGLGRVFSDNGGADGFVQLFYLKTPHTGSHTVSVLQSGGSADMESGSVSYLGVDQTTPTSNAAQGTGHNAAPTVTVTSAAGNMVAAGICCGSAITSSNDTSRWINNQNTSTAGGNGAQADAAGAASVVMDWVSASDGWGAIGVNINAAAGAVPIQAVGLIEAHVL